MLKKFVKAAGFGLKNASEEFPFSELLNKLVALMRPLAEPLLRTFFTPSVSLLDSFLCNSEIKTLPKSVIPAVCWAGIHAPYIF